MEEPKSASTTAAIGGEPGVGRRPADSLSTCRRPRAAERRRARAAAAGLHAGWSLVLHDAEDRAASMAVAGFVGGALPAPRGLASVGGLSLIVSPRRRRPPMRSASPPHPVEAPWRSHTLGRAAFSVTFGGWLVLSESPGAWGSWARAARTGDGVHCVGGRSTARGRR
ncbi:MAG: hypothetical protein WKH64_04080 [Chloroflexia bacterium]